MDLAIGSALSHLFEPRKPVLILFGVLQAGLLLCLSFYYPDYIWYFPLALLGVIYFWLSLRYPLLWVSTVILLHIPLFLQKSEEITASKMS